jgi:GR25 family glycosyltransferase involved in LPS biosynthesis
MRLRIRKQNSRHAEYFMPVPCRIQMNLYSKAMYVYSVNPAALNQSKIKTNSEISIRKQAI